MFRLCSALLFALLFLALKPAASIALSNNERNEQVTDEVQKKSCFSRLKKLTKRTVKISLASLVLSIAGSHFYHSIRAESLGYSHIGYGIYMDLDEVFQKISVRDRALIELYWKETNPEEKIELGQLVADALAESLFGEYDENAMAPRLALSSKMASSYFNNNSCEENRGVCRHKSLVLAEVLNVIGIRAKMEAGLDANVYRWHVWVRLLDSDFVVDPTFVSQGETPVFLDGSHYVIEQRLQDRESFLKEMIRSRSTPRSIGPVELPYEGLWITTWPYEFETHFGGLWR